MELFSCVTFLWISVTFYVEYGLCQTLDTVNNFKSISVSVDLNSEDIHEEHGIVFKRPTKTTTSKPVQPPPTTTTTGSPPPTTTTTVSPPHTTTTTVSPPPTTTTTVPLTMTTTLAQLQKKEAVKRTFKFKQTFIKRVYPKRVFSPDYFKYIRSFRWEDFQRRKKNNRCPWC